MKLYFLFQNPVDRLTALDRRHRHLIFLEMSRDMIHGSGSWAFPKCVWAPTEKSNGQSWPYWSKISTVQSGDTILHLRGTPPSAEFVGYSTAATVGYETDDRPPLPGEWEYAKTFYRADLEAFVSFTDSVKLEQVFLQRRQPLEDYFDRNRRLGTQKKNIFYVRQSGHLQCQNGAYFSTIDDELFEILFQVNTDTTGFEDSRSIISVYTAQQLSVVRSRIGQRKFSDEVKRAYGNRCCFPSCSITDPRFLVGSHIARWADNETLRGHLGNGLCLCLMHDKAFEIGLFTLSDRFEVVVNPVQIRQDTLLASELRLANGEKIQTSDTVLPLLEAVAEHRRRISRRH